MSKYLRQEVYESKKFKYSKFKTQKQSLNEDQNRFLTQISQMSIQKLKQFMEEKYDFIKDNHEKLECKLNNAISKRLQQFPVQLIKEQKQKIYKVFIKQGRQLKQQELNSFFNIEHYQNPIFNPNKQHCRWNTFRHEKGDRIVYFIFNDKTQNTYRVNVRIDKPEQGEFILHKRLKKQAIVVLEKLIRFKKVTLVLENQK